jgi:hypothetical protein
VCLRARRVDGVCERLYAIDAATAYMGDRLAPDAIDAISEKSRGDGAWWSAAASSKQSKGTSTFYASYTGCPL